MRILSAELHDYLSFRDCPPIEFREGINLVVGMNNVGKSALLKALNPNLVAEANRSNDRFRNGDLPSPRVTLKVRTSGERFRQVALLAGQIFIPMEAGADSQIYGGDFLRCRNLDVPLIHSGNGQVVRVYPGHGLFLQPSPDPRGFSPPKNSVRFYKDINAKLVCGEAGHIDQDSIPDFLHGIYQEDMYYFSAERLNVGSSGFHHSRRLRNDAADLPAFLSTLQNERPITFDRLKAHLRSIFSTVGDLSVGPDQKTGNAEIRIWPPDAGDEYQLSFPLSVSGTGLGQVLAILSVVMTTPESVIIIDEINSFLHPGAVKALLRLFQTEYSHHQYIISTHSPEVISFSNPSIIHVVRRRGFKSQVHSLERKQVEGIRDVVRQLGVSMTDIFLADRVIWVEGPSEELCFPELYLMATGRAVSDRTKILSVIATGDFMRKRDRELVFEIYKRLSSEVSPLVSSVSFSFDTEDLKDQEKSDIKEKSKKMIDFLPRRHLECYLIHPQSILDFIADKDHFKPRDAAPLTPGAVAATLMRLAAEMKFKIPEWQGKLDDVTWLTRVDAANLIKAVCEEISEARVTFNKNLDSLALLRLVIKNNPAQLAELGDYVRRLVDGPGE